MDDIATYKMGMERNGGRGEGERDSEINSSSFLSVDVFLPKQKHAMK